MPRSGPPRAPSGSPPNFFVFASALLDSNLVDRTATRILLILTGIRPGDDGRPTTPAPGVLRVLSRPEPSRQRVLRCRLVDAEVGRRSVARRGTGPGRTGRPGSVPFVLAYFLLEFKFDEKLLGGGGGSDGGGSGDGDGGSGTDPHPSHHPPTQFLSTSLALCLPGPMRTFVMMNDRFVLM